MILFSWSVLGKWCLFLMYPNPLLSTGRNFMLTSSMSVTIGAPCTNVVVNSDTELVATIADSSNFGDPIYLTRPKLAVVITDARGLTDYRKVFFHLSISHNLTTMFFHSLFPVLVCCWYLGPVRCCCDIKQWLLCGTRRMDQGKTMCSLLLNFIVSEFQLSFLSYTNC